MFWSCRQVSRQEVLLLADKLPHFLPISGFLGWNIGTHTHTHTYTGTHHTHTHTHTHKHKHTHTHTPCWRLRSEHRCTPAPAPKVCTRIRVFRDSIINMRAARCVPQARTAASTHARLRASARTHANLRIEENLLKERLR